MLEVVAESAVSADPAAAGITRLGTLADLLVVLEYKELLSSGKEGRK